MISKIEGLSSLKNLKELYVSNNQITTIENLDNNTSVRILDISYNSISNLERLDSLIELEDLWVRSLSLYLL